MTRAFKKTLTYRGAGSLVTAFIVLVVTGSWPAASLVGFLEFFLKAGLYYAHERIWDKHEHRIGQ